MDYAWKVHKKFILAVGGGAVALLLYNMFVLSGLRRGADKAAKDLEAERAKVEQALKDGEPTEDALKQADLSRAQSLKQLGRLAREMSFEPPDRFRKPASGAKSYVDRLKIDVPRELVAAAAKKNVGCPPKVGLDDAFPEEMGEEILLRLAVLERVVGAALNAGIERIEQIDALHGADRRAEPVAQKGAFLNRFPVMLKLRGSEDSVFALVHALQKKNSFLSLVHLEIDRPTPAKDSLACTLAVSAVRVDEKSPIESKGNP